MNNLVLLRQQVVACQLCSRLREYCQQVAAQKRRSYRDWDYWGKPVPSFGDPRARLLVIGLAPAAHGANRTGRMFTGDRSGDFLFRAMHSAGFATQAESRASDDGLELRDAYVTAAVRCAPPDNRPSPQEIRTCRPYLEREIALLRNVQVVVALGRLAFDAYLAVLKDQGKIARRSSFQFGHNIVHEVTPLLISSYHPSQQNTSTGRLTFGMLETVFQRAHRLLGGR